MQDVIFSRFTARYGSGIIELREAILLIIVVRGPPLFNEFNRIEHFPEG